MDILYNDKGVPLMISSKKALFSTSGYPEVDRKKLIQPKAKERDKINVGSHRIIQWGSNNDFPQWADKIITSTGVLNTGLKFIRNFTIGQGIYACTIEGYDDKGNEILKPYTDDSVTAFLSSRVVRRYMEKVLRDYLKFGSGFVQLIPNEDGKLIVGLNPLNDFYVRLTEPDINGSEKCIVSGKWPDTPSDGDFNVYDVLQEYDPAMDLDIRRFEGKQKNSTIMVIRDSWSNKDDYSEPVWLACYLAGWIGIAKSVPKYLEKMNKNQATWKWHIQIPYSFWDKQFPETKYESVGARKKDIDAYMDDIENNMLGEENAEKPIFTFYAINEFNGRIEEEWKITPLDNKSKESDKLVTSAAANSEILFSLMINPNVLGAGMPGGAYAGNQGGSNIREAFLVNIANAWIDRRSILDPIEVMLNYNGHPNIVLRFRNTILTTLDTGAGTSKTLS